MPFVCLFVCVCLCVFYAIYIYIYIYAYICNSSILKLGFCVNELTICLKRIRLSIITVVHVYLLIILDLLWPEICDTLSIMVRPFVIWSTYDRSSNNVLFILCYSEPNRLTSLATETWPNYCKINSGRIGQWTALYDYHRLTLTVY